MQHQWIPTLISFGVVALVLLLRMRRMGQTRRLNIERLWLMPACFGAAVILLYWAHPPHGLGWLYAALALAFGIPLGWWRGKFMRISVDAQTHEVSQQGSPAGMIFILLLVMIRYAARGMAEAGAAAAHDAYLATDVLLALGLGFVVAQRLEMGLRARRLLEAARSGRPA